MRKHNFTKIDWKWIKSVGGQKAAADLIQGTLKCSRSKAEKLAGRRYPSKVQPLEEAALMELTRMPSTSPVSAGEGARAS